MIKKFIMIELRKNKKIIEIFKNFKNPFKTRI